MNYPRSNIQALDPYVPGEQPSDPSVIKLNTNENPYPPAQGVREAIAAVTGEALRRYPSPAASTFRQTAARVHQLQPSQVIATNGGDELIRLAVTVFCDPRPGRKGDAGTAPGGLGMTAPSYSLYQVLGAIHDTPVTTVPLADGFEIPDDFADRLNAAGCRLAFIVNPHAPSGQLRSLDQLRRIARGFQGVLMIDEAYVDFAAADALSLIRLDGPEALPNVLILRTLSKGYSLAGLRFGYGLGHPDLIAAMDKARDSYNTDVLSQAAAVAALEHREYARGTWQAVIQQRDWLTTQLAQRGYQVLPSQSNFVLAKPPGNLPPARATYESLKAQRILVRYFDQDRLRDRLRITIGTPEQNQALLDALDRLG